MSLEILKAKLGTHLLRPEQVTALGGLSTGWARLDRFLLWHGFPKGALTLLISEAGGATTLWTQSAATLTCQRQWVAWVEGPESSLMPAGLRHRNVKLDRLLYVSQPKDLNQTLWVLQELMGLCLFELIGCDLGPMNFKEHQILKLQRSARKSAVSLVLFSSSLRISSFYSLILHFQKKPVIVRRALHRPTPYTLERRDLYADTLPQLTAGRYAFK
jgi:hypothetical protein